MKFLLVFFLFSFSESWALDPAALQKALDKSGIAKKDIAIFVANDAGKIFESRSTEMMTPASLTKLVVLGSVMKYLPAEIKWKTQIYKKGSDICLVGGGDPSFVSENMWVLVNNFKRGNLHKVENIYVDASRFDNELFDKGRMDVRVARAFDAPVSAMSFNWNSVNVYIKPGSSAGEKASVSLDPENDYVIVENRVTTVKGSTVPKQSIDIERIEESGGKNRFIVKGKIGVNNEEAVLYRSITRPDLWAGYNLKSFLKQRGIETSGEVKTANCSSWKDLAAGVESKDLKYILNDMMKFSNNFVTEMLVKNIAYEKGARPGSIDKAMPYLQDYLKSIGMEAKDYKIASVSGFSNENRFRAIDLYKILQDVVNNPRMSPEALSAFPIAGIDGTIKSRMRGASTRELVRAKTGLLNTVVGLAGFAHSPKDGLLFFVLMYNGNKTFEARDFFDHFVEQTMSTR